MSDPRPAGVQIIRYTGESMWPTFQEGDLLLVKEAPIRTLRRGNCIVFKEVGKANLVVHRIFNSNPPFITKADGRRQIDDGFRREEDIVGIVTARYRCGVKQKVANGEWRLDTRIFFDQAARLDPRRNTKGGRIAGFLSHQIKWAFKPLIDYLQFAKYDSPEGITVSILLKTKPVAYFSIKNGMWTVFWPISILLDPSIFKNRSTGKK